MCADSVTLLVQGCRSETGCRHGSSPLLRSRHQSWTRDSKGAPEAVPEPSAVAPREDRPHGIQPRCAGMIGLIGKVDNGLLKQSIIRAPAIDPGVFAVAMVQVLIDSKLSWSRRAYPLPLKVEHPTSMRHPVLSRLPI
jgi:hypothetical protein